MSTTTGKPKDSMNADQTRWLKRMGMALGIALHIAAPQAAVSSSSSTSSLNRGSATSTAPGPSGSAAVGSKDIRVVQGGGGYVFEQHADGKIFIIQSPKHGNERVEVKKTPDSKVYDAVLKQIGPFAKAPQAASAATTAPAAAPTDAKGTENLGGLSTKYETGGRGCATVSTGKGDAGGVSYGTYQLSSKTGTAQEFVNRYYAQLFKGKTPGSEEFTATWKQLAKDHAAELSADEHQFISDTHYGPFAKRLKADLGLDLDKHSKALRDAAWSTAVQNGPGNHIFQKALESAVKEKKLDQLTDAEIIKAVYGERGRVDAAGVPVHFSKSKPDVQKGVLKRFKHEQEDALKELEAEAPAKPLT